MNERQVKEYLDGLGLQISNPSYSPQLGKFVEVANRLRPHFDGKPPKTFFERYFEKEGQQMINRRIGTYISESKDLLNQALRNLGRLLIGNRFAIAGDTDFMVAIGKQPFADNYDFTSWLCYSAYRARAIDPNGLVCVEPVLVDKYFNPIVTAQNQTVPLQFTIYQSSQILHIDSELVVVRLTNNVYRVFTKTMCYVCNADFTTIINSYVHNGGMLGIRQLGGKHEQEIQAYTYPFAYYLSDFDSLTDALDKLAVCASESNEVSRLAYPTRTRFAAPCETCDGTGQLHDGSTCKDCGGTGTKKLMTGEEYILLAQPNQENTMPALPIVYAAPPAQSFDQSNKRLADAIETVQNALHILRNNATVASGASKEKDRDFGYMFIDYVANALREIGYYLLQTFAVYIYPVESIRMQKIESLTVAKPTDYALDSLAELENKAVQNIASKSWAMRYEEQRDIYIKRFGVDSPQVRKLEIAYHWTKGVCMALPSELPALIQNGLLTAENAQRAQFARVAIDKVFDNTLQDAQLIDAAIKYLTA